MVAVLEKVEVPVTGNNIDFNMVRVTGDLAVIAIGKEAKFVDISSGSIVFGTADTWTTSVLSVEVEHIVLMNSTQILLVFTDATVLKIIRLDLDLLSKTITHSTEVTVDTAPLGIDNIKMTRQNGAKAFMVWQYTDTAATPPSELRGCTIDFPSLGVGTIDYISDNNTEEFSDPSCVSLSSTRVFAGYDHADSGTDGKSYVVVLTVSGNTFSRGTRAVLDSDIFAEGFSIISHDMILFDTDKVAIVDIKGQYRICTVSGTTITLVGSALTLSASNNSLDKADPNTLFYAHTSTLTAGICGTLNVSGTTITDNLDSLTYDAGTDHTYNVNIKMAGDRGLIAYNDTGANKTFIAHIGQLPDWMAGIDDDRGHFYYEDGLPLLYRSDVPITDLDIGNMAVNEDNEVFVATNTAADAVKVAQAELGNLYAQWGPIDGGLDADEADGITVV